MASLVRDVRTDPTLIVDEVDKLDLSHAYLWSDFQALAAQPTMWSLASGLRRASS